MQEWVCGVTVGYEGPRGAVQGTHTTSAYLLRALVKRINIYGEINIFFKFLHACPAVVEAHGVRVVHAYKVVIHFVLYDVLDNIMGHRVRCELGLAHGVAWRVSEIQSHLFGITKADDVREFFICNRMGMVCSEFQETDATARIPQIPQTYHTWQPSSRRI